MRQVGPWGQVGPGPGPGPGPACCLSTISGLTRFDSLLY